MTNHDSLLHALHATPQDAAEQALAARYAPILRFDANEPFLPLAAGYTLFYAEGPSPSFPRRVELARPGRPAAALAIEYAIWWDWDIQHLYELEHVWIYVDDAGQIVAAEASWHGGYHDMQHEGSLDVVDGRFAVYSEPGKHAFAPTPEWFRTRWQAQKRSTSDELAGLGGVLVTDLFAGELDPLRTPQNNTLARTFLADHAFQPGWRFSQEFRFEPRQLVPWPALAAWIPPRLAWWTERLAAQIPAARYRFLRIGHRGAAAHAPDNTLAGIRKAAELGADAVEIDVQMTADDQAVVIHESCVTDADGQTRAIHHLTLAELQAIDVGQGERVPTLSAVIAACEEEQIGLYIEIKDGRAVPTLVELSQEQGLPRWAIVGSFRADWLAELKAQVPTIETSILFSSPHVDAVQLAQSIQASYVHPCWERYPSPSQLLTPEWIDAVRQAHLGIVCWHEERPSEITALRRLGVDGICSDAPELLVPPALSPKQREQN